MSKKLPAIQFYIGDWRKDPGVQSLDYEIRGVWFEILMLMHESNTRGLLLLNNQKMPTKALSQLLGLDNNKTKQIISKLLSYGVASTDEKTGALYCRRMLRDENLRKVRADAGKLGGSKIKANPKQKRTPSSSSSSSSSNNKGKIIKEKRSQPKDWLEKTTQQLSRKFDANKK